MFKFNYAMGLQAEALFKRIFAKPSTVLQLSDEELSSLAKRFADAIPQNELSVRVIVRWMTSLSLWVKQVTDLQGYLLKNKTRPQQCVDEVLAWYEYI